MDIPVILPLESGDCDARRPDARDYDRCRTEVNMRCRHGDCRRALPPRAMAVRRVVGRTGSGAIISFSLAAMLLEESARERSDASHG